MFLNEAVMMKIKRYSLVQPGGQDESYMAEDEFGAWVAYSDLILDRRIITAWDPEKIHGDNNAL